VKKMAPKQLPLANASFNSRERRDKLVRKGEKGGPIAKGMEKGGPTQRGHVAGLGRSCLFKDSFLSRA
jgi:hypothetical protein